MAKGLRLVPGILRKGDGDAEEPNGDDDMRLPGGPAAKLCRLLPLERVHDGHMSEGPLEGQIVFGSRLDG